MDIFLTHEGDLLRDTTGNDFEYVFDDDEVLQDIAIRIKSYPGDFAYFQDIGCELSTLVGQLMTPDTLLQGESLIYQALNSSPLLVDKQVTVRGIPVATNEALFVIAIQDTAIEEQLFLIPFDFERGMLRPRSHLDELRTAGVVASNTDIIGTFPLQR